MSLSMTLRPHSLRSGPVDIRTSLYQASLAGTLRSIPSWPGRLLHVIFGRTRQGSVANKPGNAPTKQNEDPTTTKRSKPPQQLKKGIVPIPRHK